MGDHKAMSDERLARIRQRHAVGYGNILTERPIESPILGWMVNAFNDQRDLLAEVDRLRAEVARLQGIIATDDPGVCKWCRHSIDRHTPGCPVTEARAALAQEGEAE